MDTPHEQPPAAPADQRIVVRQAMPSDARRIFDIVEPYAREKVLITKALIAYFESIQEFVVADLEIADGEWLTVGCGALHVLWDDIAEIRTAAVAQEFQRRGIGRRVVAELIDRARDFGLTRLFCLTFEVDFFESFGFRVIEGTPVGTDVYEEMLRSHDDGVAEFLDLARVKPNTLGNSRMLLDL
ncbi:MAG TPA: amino-acid N-acetyltransferase [Actinomycetaceae bacterium]|nr:amino-acid N-acetyltransferase [Actinomycetaceae bacterium]